MHIISVGLRNFRNYESLLLNPPEGTVWITGHNAQGKTNFIEAIAMSSTGRSHRTRKDKDLILWGQKAAGISVKVQRQYAPHEVRIEFFQNDVRKIEINGAAAIRVGELMGNVNTVLFAPEDLRLIKDGPQERRRFMDMELSQAVPTYFFSLQKYQKALKQRNSLLRQISEKPSLIRQLDAWEETLARPAAEIYRERTRFAERIGILVKDIHAIIAGNKESLKIRYRPNPDPGDSDFYDEMMKTLSSQRQEDIRQGVTSVGPHRDDLILNIDGRDARIFASQGQQRTAALAMKLSEVGLLREQTGENPILLLDDVMSELDTLRKDALLEWIGGVQTFITAASMESIPDKSAAVYRIENGRILSD